MGVNSTEELHDKLSGSLELADKHGLQIVAIHICHALEHLREENSGIDISEGNYDTNSIVDASPHAEANHEQSARTRTKTD